MSAQTFWLVNRPAPDEDGVFLSSLPMLLCLSGGELVLHWSMTKSCHLSSALTPLSLSLSLPLSLSPHRLVLRSEALLNARNVQAQEGGGEQGRAHASPAWAHACV
jgi:hypothetical protein